MTSRMFVGLIETGLWCLAGLWYLAINRLDAMDKCSTPVSLLSAGFWLIVGMGSAISFLVSIGVLP